MEAAFSIQAISAVDTVDGSSAQHASAMDLGATRAPRSRFGGVLMHSVTTTRLDVAKSVFQVHGIDAAGQVSNTA